MKLARKIILFVGLALALVAGYFVYSVFFGSNYDSLYSSGRVLQSPVLGLTDAEAVLAFDEDFIYYVLVGIKAYNLHAPPFSSDTPKIEFRADDDMFNAEIVDGRIIVSEGEISGEDIIIDSSKLEVVKMIRNRNYIRGSFASGNSKIEFVTSEGVLAMKGYLKIYSSLTGT